MDKKANLRYQCYHGVILAFMVFFIGINHAEGLSFCVLGGVLLSCHQLSHFQKDSSLVLVLTFYLTIALMLIGDRLPFIGALFRLS